MTTNFEIRIATTEDVDAIIQVMQGVYTEYGFLFEAAEETPDLLNFDRNYNRQSGIFFVGEVENKVVGTIGIKFVEPTTTEIFRLYLNDSFRGLGLGRRLLDTAVQWARANKASKIILWSDTRFKVAHKLYTRAGFVQGPLRHTNDVNNSIEYQFTLELERGDAK